MIDNEPKSNILQTDVHRVPTLDTAPKTVENTVATKPKTTSLKEDPDYLAMKDQLGKAWLERTDVEPLSGDHQDYLFGNPADHNAPTLDKDAELAFREQHADRATEYDRDEKMRAYEKISDDPAYGKMQEQITVRTNADSQVRVASKSGRDWGGTWDRVNTRENIHGMNDFARQYPEKAQAYADRWNDFIDKHPEIAGMNNAEWHAWCSERPGALSMSEYRNMERAVEHVKRRKEMDLIQPRIHTAEKGLAEARADLGIAEPPTKVESETPLAREKEKLNSLQLADVASEMRASIPAEMHSANTEALYAMQQELADLPYVPGEDVKEILDYDGEDEGVMMVDTDAIVGSVSGAFEDWSSEYGSRKGRVVDVAQQLMKGTEETIDHVFHVKDPKHGVKLKKVSGPGGDLFFVVDGTHRVAGSKLARLPELPAQVENMTELTEVRTTDPLLKSQWEERIRRGLIRGTIEETTTTADRKTFHLKIESQVLPWMNLPQNKLIKMTKFYLEHYPSSLDNLKSFTTGEKIPKEALLDQVAMNFYLAGRWDEYTLRQ